MHVNVVSLSLKELCQVLGSICSMESRLNAVEVVSVPGIVVRRRADVAGEDLPTVVGMPKKPVLAEMAGMTVTENDLLPGRPVVTGAPTGAGGVTVGTLSLVLGAGTTATATATAPGPGSTAPVQAPGQTGLVPGAETIIPTSRVRKAALAQVAVRRLRRVKRLSMPQGW